MTDVVEEGRPSVSVIVPTLNEERSIGCTLSALAKVRGDVELIVVDGGSGDRTTEIARELGARIVTSERGRGIQMHNGARVARGSALLFLHADTVAPAEVIKQISDALARDAALLGGNCSIRFDGESRPARFMTWLYPKLARLGMCYGDSGIFVRAHVYDEIGGFKPFPIFEDLDFIRRLKKKGRMVRLPVELTTSSRRFEERSFVLTFARWTILQVLYWLGVSPEVLGELYGRP
ncbi:MAG TPA: TIGR04283 family arsenosugar biosynthesis glycosyltransferase [Pyrinomonadaceae bacterium]|nr:TIGR04283 family arsenosugar biosynthesis glycosyltransferase [Pyrinomonadaceae bacterium]